MGRCNWKLYFFNFFIRRAVIAHLQMLSYVCIRTWHVQNRMLQRHADGAASVTWSRLEDALVPPAPEQRVNIVVLNTCTNCFPRTNHFSNYVRRGAGKLFRRRYDLLNNKCKLISHNRF